MSSIVSLIRKDILLSSNYLLFVAAYLVFLTYTTTSYNLFDVSLFVTMPSIMLLINSCMMDVRTMNQQFALSLPVRRSQIVIAKYISILPYLLFGLGCMYLSYFILDLAGRPENIHWHDISFTVLLVPATAAIYLPIYYWLGSKGQQIINTVFFMIIFFGSMNLRNLMESFPWLDDFIARVNSFSLIESMAAVFLYLVFIFASYLVSLRIFTARDL